MRAVIIGPGRIGCGFAGQLFRQAGYELVFVGHGPVVDNLDRLGCYRVRLTDGVQAREILVDGVRAVPAADRRAVAGAIASADLVAVSVGARCLASAARVLAEGLGERSAPVNVLAFENVPDAGSWLEAATAELSPARVDEPRHGFSSVLVSRVVAHRIGDPSGTEPLTFLGDPPDTFVVHGPSLRAPLPAIPGMIAVDDHRAWFLKKLYTFGAGHAATAYLGALKGYHYVHTAIQDPEIRDAVLAAMEEGRRGLVARFGAAIAGDRGDLERIVARFENAALADSIARVGRDPLRKLGCEDRLVGAARLAEQAGTRPRRLALATAAAMCFHCPGDPEACSLQRDLAAFGLGPTLQRVSGLDPDRGIGRIVAACWQRLAEGREKDNLLLSLRRRMWSWRRAGSARPGKRHRQRGGAARERTPPIVPDLAITYEGTRPLALGSSAGAPP